MKRIFCLFLIICFFCSIQTTANAQQVPDSAQTTTSTVQSVGIANGAHIRPDVNYGTVINTFNQTSGKPIAVVMYFLDWSGVPTSSLVFDTYLPDLIRSTVPSGNYPVIMLSWEPMNGRASEGCDQNYGTSIPLSTITQGKCDGYISKFATELSARPERFLIRLAHEMNITDSPWWPGHYGQDASAYVAMWRHIHDLIASVQNSLGKHNIEWVWSINYASNPPDAWNAIPYYYPGNSYVDWIGLSGYNWYNAPGHNIAWKSFTVLFDKVLKDLACSYAKPQIITEIGSAGTATEKSGWIQDAFQKMSSYPFLRGIVWFNDFAYANPNQADFRVINSPNISPVNAQVTSAYQSSISSTNFVSTLPALNAATPSGTICLGKRISIPFARK